LKDLFNYSYPEIDLENYLSNFEKKRIKKIESSKRQKFSKKIKIDQRFVEIEKLINELDSNHIAHDSQIDTFTYLCKVYNLFFNKKEIKSEQKEKIYLLQHKFEVFKRLFSVYDKNKFVKAMDISADVKVYALLSIVLNSFFLESNDYNALNTATKLIDLCLSFKDELRNSEISLIEHAIGLEFYCIEHCINNFSIH